MQDNGLTLTAATPVDDVIQKADAMIVDARATFAELIRDRAESAFREAAQNVLDLARIVAEAKNALGTTEWLLMIERDLGWRKRSAYYLVSIAESALPECNFVAQLPASWGTLAQLSRLDAATIKKSIETGHITPEMTRADVARLVPPAPKKRKTPKLILIAHRFLPRGQWPKSREILEAAAQSSVYVRRRDQLEHLRETEPELAPAIDDFNAEIERANKIVAAASERLIAATKNASDKGIPWPPKPADGGAAR